MIPITATHFSELPLSQFDNMRYSVYVINHSWDYLYVNNFVRVNLGEKGQNLIGMNMWKVFPELELDPSFRLLRHQSERGIDSDFTTISPITAQKLRIQGKALKDCYLFMASVLPSKEEVLQNIREELNKRKKAS